MAWTASYRPTILRNTNELIPVITKARATASNHWISLIWIRLLITEEQRKGSVKTENRTKLPHDCTQPRCWWAGGQCWFFQLQPSLKAVRGPPLSWPSILSAPAPTEVGPFISHSGVYVSNWQSRSCCISLWFFIGGLLSAAFHATDWMGIQIRSFSFEKEK